MPLELKDREKGLPTHRIEAEPGPTENPSVFVFDSIIKSEHQAPREDHVGKTARRTPGTQ